MDNEKIKSVFLGEINENKAKLQDGRNWNDIGYYTKPYINTWQEAVETKIILKTEISKPPYELNEEVYLSELNEHVKIKKIVKGTDGSITYTTDYAVDIVNEEIFNKKYKEEETKLNRELMLYRKWKEENDKKVNEEPEYKYKSLYLCEVLGLITHQQTNIVLNLQKNDDFVVALQELQKLK